MNLSSFPDLQNLSLNLTILYACCLVLKLGIDLI